MSEHRPQAAILCPICRRLTSASADRCPYCNTAHPGSWWKNNKLVRNFGQPESYIHTIIVANSVMFAISLLLSNHGPGFSFNPLNFLSPDSRALIIMGGTGTIPIDQIELWWSLRWWSLITANYLHGSIMHIVFNMIALNQIGPLIIGEYGGYRMLIIYTGGGILGFLLSYFAGVPLTIGASAAICALIGAALFFGKHRGGAYGEEVYKQVIGWVVGLFIFGLMVPGIDNWGHGGGLVGGALLGYLLGYQDQGREKSIHKILAAACVGITILALGWAISTSFFYRMMG
ncbi:MAG: rhomboid family intramembrane serine protease [Desulfobulbaceae bacterium]|nr:rhomboid family intramembrane serine protease [Desulfobulbaceae bacterium]